MFLRFAFGAGPGHFGSERDVSTHYLKKRIIVKTVRFSASQCALSPDEESRHV